MNWLKRNSKNHFLTEDEIQRVAEAVQRNEQHTSGEIRVYMESHCQYMEPLHRAAELFLALKMHNTEHRNAVLLYIAYHDKDVALYGDRQIFHQTDPNFWHQQTKNLLRSFHQNQYCDGIITCLDEIGLVLASRFPLKGEAKNELPDDIVFGK